MDYFENEYRKRIIIPNHLASLFLSLSPTNVARQVRVRVVAWSREVKCSNEVAMIEWPVLVYRVDTSISTSTSNAVPAVADRFEALPLRAMHPDYCERVRDRVERPRKTVLPGPISWWDPRCRSANATWKCKTSNRRRFFYSTLFFLFFLSLFPLFLSSSSSRNSDREDENKEWM